VDAINGNVRSRTQEWKVATADHGDDSWTSHRSSVNQLKQVTGVNFLLFPVSSLAGFLVETSPPPPPTPSKQLT
jgi:hypothetical protein